MSDTQDESFLQRAIAITEGYEDVENWLINKFDEFWDVKKANNLLPINRNTGHIEWQENRSSFDLEWLPGGGSESFEFHGRDRWDDSTTFFTLPMSWIKDPEGWLEKTLQEKKEKEGTLF